MVASVTIKFFLSKFQGKKGNKWLYHGSNTPNSK